MHFSMQNPNLKSVGRNRKPIDNSEKTKNFRIIGGFRCRLTKMDTGFRFASQKNKKKKTSSIFSIRKILAIPKYQDR